MFDGHEEAVLRIARDQGWVPPAEPALGAADLLRRLLRDGPVTRPRLLAAVARAHGMEFRGEDWGEPDAAARSLLPPEAVRRMVAMPWRRDAGVCEVLCGNPFVPSLQSDLAFALGARVRLVLIDPDQAAAMIDGYCGVSGALISAALARGDGSAGEAPAISAERMAELAGLPAVVQLVDRLVEEALRSRASDLHFEPFEGSLRVRMRVDGALREVETCDGGVALAVASRLKVLANLDIAERRLPQDGRIHLRRTDRNVDLRISTLPTQHGESIVLRLLDASGVRPSLDALGMPGPVLRVAREVLARPNGILIVTGPTGSGKTTTLYGCLHALHAPDVKILTAEDPVEYEVDGITQVGVAPDVGLSFAAALRSFLRQDPDVVMIGEVRDLETAQIAVQAALTGHLVLTTLHTNDAPTAITRLLDMGVEPFLLASSLEAVLAQRLLRRLCRHCRERVLPSPAQRAALAGWDAMAGGVEFFQGRGCGHCGGTGYSGRVPAFEAMRMSDALREALAAPTSARVLRQRAEESGMIGLRAEACRLAAEGVTSLEEVLRHT